MRLLVVMLTRVPALSSPVGPDDLDDGVVRKSRTGRRVIPAARAGLTAVVALVLSGCLALSGCGSIGHLPPIPDGIPPAPGAPTPAINLDAPGRTAEQLHDWAAARSRPRHPGDGARGIRLRRGGHGPLAPGLRHRLDHRGRHRLRGEQARQPWRRAHRCQRQRRPAHPRHPPGRIPGVARILDQDATTRTGSPVYVRAMGPFQFLPETWQRWGVDANGDGIADPTASTTPPSPPPATSAPAVATSPQPPAGNVPADLQPVHRIHDGGPPGRSRLQRWALSVIKPRIPVRSAFRPQASVVPSARFRVRIESFGPSGSDGLGDPGMRGRDRGMPARCDVDTPVTITWHVAGVRPAPLR